MTTPLHQPAADTTLWTPDQDPALLGCVLVLDGLHVTALTVPGVGVGAHPTLFVLLGHHRGVTATQAAALYMERVHAWTHWCLYPGDDPDDVIPRIPRAVHTHATIHTHDDSWHLTWAHSTAPGTAMRHPAALAAAVFAPDPDHTPNTTWAR
ncbi:hypothetical protein [Streptomyces wedmorensis]